MALLFRLDQPPGHRLIRKLLFQRHAAGDTRYLLARELPDPFLDHFSGRLAEAGDDHQIAVQSLEYLPQCGKF